MGAIRKILIIRFSSIGDIVLSSPLLRILRTRYPEARIDFLVKSGYADLVRYNPHISSVIELRSSKWNELNALRKRVADERYDVVLDIHNGLRSRYLRQFSHAHTVGVIDKQVLKRWALVNFHWNLYSQDVPVVQRTIEAANHGASLDIEDDGQGLEVFVPNEISAKIATLLAHYGMKTSDAVVGIAPCAKHNTKMWLAERFTELAIRAVQEMHAKILCLGGIDDAERCEDIVQHINSACGSQKAHNVAGQFSLLETSAALDSCSAVVCNDSAIMHLATARKRPVIAIFGPTVREFGFFPYGDRSMVIEQKDLACRPCSHLGSERCPLGHFRCMKDTTVDHVFQALGILAPHPLKTTHL